MIKTERGKSKNFNILFTCIGRRVSLLNNFRRAAKELGIRAQFVGTDVTELSPALQLCDKKHLIKPISHSGYIAELLRIVKENKVALLVPTIDTDLQKLADNKARFQKLGCSVLVSSSDVISICQDKRKTFQFLSGNGFDSPITVTVREVLSQKRISWPKLLKPWDGAAGRGVALVNNRDELLTLSKRISNSIVQDYVRGEEYTCDVYVDFDRQVRCVVPRKRIEIRGGEVSKGQTVKNRGIMSTVGKLVEKLGAGPGIITVQLILTEKGQMKFIEINPRFGGGAPLSIKAGANFPKWILQELLGQRATIKFDGFKDGLTMLRYDAEIWA